ncbi:MAG TPA: PilT/PilU family type 4a pilus ATPase [bacterium]|jgi:twitching motility protein PilT|nr:PilT/PilU family type 4a pilus ATPase [bacterium]
MDLQQLLHSMVEKKASDVHLKTGAPPLFRIDGDLTPQSDTPLTLDEMKAVAVSLMDEKQQKLYFEDRREVDLAYAMEGLARFRTNILWQRGIPEIVMRVIPQHVPNIDEINMPTAVLKQIAAEPRGLILVTGITGSGKSTTLAAMINEMNTNRYAHIVTVEDPIEFVHRDKKSSVTQREVGLDTESFKSALKYVLRQDPDIILVGEMRDVETVSAAISAAETGHLVLSTLHTMDTTQTIERILDFFPPEQQNQIRIQLSNTLRAVISQRLVTKAGGVGVVPACEIMIVTPTIKSLIAEGKISSIRQFIAEGNSQYGMQTFDQSLIALVRGNFITKESAMEQASSPNEIDLGLKGISSSRSSAQSLMSQLDNDQQKERVAGWMRRAQDYFDKRRYDESRIELKRILQELPEHKEANILMAQVRELDSKTEKKKDASGMIKGALQMYREGKAQAAVLEFQKALEVDPANKQALAYIKSIQDELENKAKALQFYQAAMAYKQQNDLGNALASAEQVLTLDPNHEQANLLVRDLKKAAQQEQAKLKAESLNQAAIESYKAGDLLGALVSWNKAFEVNSELEEVSRYIQQGIGQILSVGVDGLDGNPEKAIVLGLFEQGIRGYVKGDFQSATEFFKRGLSKAEGNVYLNAYLQKATQMQDVQLKEFYQEGMLQLQAGHLLQAQKEFTKVVRLSPGHPDAMRQIEVVKQEMQKLAEKIYAEGKQYFDANDMDRAIRVWSRIFEFDPLNEKIQKKIEEAKIKKNTLSDIFSKIS